MALSEFDPQASVHHKEPFYKDQNKNDIMGIDDLRKSAALDCSDLGVTLVHADESHFIDKEGVSDLLMDKWQDGKKKERKKSKISSAEMFHGQGNGVEINVDDESVFIDPDVDLTDS